MDADLNQYYDPAYPGSFGGVNRLYRSLKDDGKQVTKKDVKVFLDDQNTYTLHKEKRVSFPRNRIIAHQTDFQWAADLADMSNIARENKGVRYLLTVIDVFSKYLWLRPLKDKRPATVNDALLSILREGRKPERLRTDRGSEFLNKTVKRTLDKNRILHLLTTNKSYKAATVERVQRTLKGRMYRYFTRTGSHKYIDKLDEFTNGYNNSYHRTIKMTPNEAVKANRKTVFFNTYGVESMQDIPTLKKPKLKTGDTVRLAYDRNVFDKGYWRTHTDQTATITDVLERPLPMYKLKDYTGPLKRRFYAEELQKIPEPAYRIEKVIKTRTRNGKKQFFVKFIGYPSSENSWVDELQSV